MAPNNYCIQCNTPLNGLKQIKCDNCLTMVRNLESMNGGKVFEEIKTFSNRRLLERLERIIRHLESDRFYNNNHPEIEQDKEIVLDEVLSRMYNPEVVKLEVKSL